MFSFIIEASVLENSGNANSMSWILEIKSSWILDHTINKLSLLIKLIFYYYSYYQCNKFYYTIILNRKANT